MKRIHYILATALILTVVLSGCGGGKGGGGNGGDPPAPPPGSDLAAPQITKVTAADRQLTVEWSAVAGAAGYLVWWGSSNDTGTSGKSSYETADTSYAITGLSNDIAYYIFVQAKNSAGVSSPSSLASGAPIQSTTAPAAPGTPVLMPGNGQLTVKWEAVNGATFYDVYCSTGGSPPDTPAQQNITATSCAITGLNNGTAYNVWVKAGNAIGTSGFSNPANMAPGPPSSPAAPVLSLGEMCINVSWIPVTGATGYEVHYSYNGGEIFAYFDTNGNSYTIPARYGTGTYAVWIIAKNNIGKSGNSPSTSIQFYVSIGEIAGGTGSYKDGDRINFGKTFSKIPTIVVNACDATGKPLIAGVRDESGSAPDNTGFTLKLHDLANNVVASNATVQWVAIISDFSESTPVQARTDSYHYDGEYIKFDHSFSSIPIVICSAYDKYDNPTMAYPLMVAPYSISENGFTISLKDADGIQSQGSVHYIALVPPSNYNFYKEVAMVAGYTMYNNNGSVLFDLTRNADAVLCSAQKDNFAYAVAARKNNDPRYGFALGLLDYDGNVRTSVWTSWLALGFK
jgi:hypothetical protein